MANEKERGINYRWVAQSLWDGSCWLVAVLVAVLLRYDGYPNSSYFFSALLLGVSLGLIQVVLDWAVKRVRGRRVLGSFDEISIVTFNAALVTLLGAVVVAIGSPPPLPRSVPFIAGSIALTLMLGGRFTFRAYRQRSLFSQDAERVLIYGAGDSGDQIIRQMLATPSAKYLPVGIIDDNPGKYNLRLHGVKVVGDNSKLEQTVQRTGAAKLVVAIAGIDSKSLLELDRRCNALGITLSVIPTTSELIGGAIKLGDISHVTDEDLLGRRPIHTDEKGISDLLRGKRILITGAGGSIGSELSRQVHRYEPAFVGLLDRDESALHSVQLSIDGRGLLDTENLILGDIRDADWMNRIMKHVQPEIVFHSAALKHLPLLERYPEEARKTNIEGTKNVINAATSAGVKVFVNISTDKAADPTCVLGQSKLVTEQLTANVQPIDGEKFISVRFGNVLGSRGSVLTAFRYQIEKGGPLTVTDPEVTRYFMTIPEAVHLVLQAAVLGDHAETLILDMGEPIKIDDVAKRMIEKSGRDIQVVYTGLRVGEKLTEVLFSSDEDAVTKSHPQIFHTRVTPISANTN